MIPKWVVLAAIPVLGAILVGPSILASHQQATIVSLKADRDSAIARRDAADQRAMAAARIADSITTKAAVLELESDSLRRVVLKEHARIRIVGSGRVIIAKDSGSVPTDTVPVPPEVTQALQDDLLTIGRLESTVIEKDAALVKKDVVILNLETALAQDTIALSRQAALTKVEVKEARAAGRVEGAIITAALLTAAGIALRLVGF